MKQYIFIGIMIILTITSLIYWISNNHVINNTEDQHTEDEHNEEWEKTIVLNIGDEWNNFCTELLKISDIKSEKFKNFAHLDNITTYLSNNNIITEEPCLKYKDGKIDSLKSECVMDDNAEIQNLFLGLYLNDSISEEYMLEWMEKLYIFYRMKNPLNAISIKAIYDKQTGIFISEDYCENALAT